MTASQSTASPGHGIGAEVETGSNMRHLQAPHNGLARAVGVQLPQATFPVTRRRLSTQRNQHGGTARTAQPRQSQTDRQTGQPGPGPAWPEASLHTTSWLLEETLPDFAFLLLTTEALTSAQACAHVCTRASAAGCLCTRAPAAWAGHASPRVFAPKLCQGPWPGPTPAFCLGMGSCLSHPPRAGPASSLCSRGPPTPRADQP